MIDWRLAKLRFFRDMVDAERTKVFSAFFGPAIAAEAKTHGMQSKLFNVMAVDFSALPDLTVSDDIETAWKKFRDENTTLPGAMTIFSAGWFAAKISEQDRRLRTLTTVNQEAGNG